MWIRSVACFDGVWGQSVKTVLGARTIVSLIVLVSAHACLTGGVGGWADVAAVVDVGTVQMLAGVAFATPALQPQLLFSRGGPLVVLSHTDTHCQY